MVCTIPMMNPTLLPSPEVLTSQRVTQVSRALFVSLGALLGPLLAQHLFAPTQLTVAQWLVPIGLNAVFALWISLGLRPLMGGAAVSGLGAALRMLRRTVSLGVLNGVVCALIWSATLHGSFTSILPAAVVFGVFYGLWIGLGFALPFTLWTFFARKNLDAPSMLSRQVLSLRAGMFLSFAGLVGTVFYHHEVLQTLSQCLGVAGFVVALLGLIGMIRVSRFFATLETASIPGLHLVDRGGDTSTPAVLFAGSAPNDRLAIVAPEALDNAPFRENSTDRRLAAVPSDLGLARRALNRSLSFGAIGLLVVTAADALSLSAPYLQSVACHRSADCGGCAH